MMKSIERKATLNSVFIFIVYGVLGLILVPTASFAQNSSSSAAAAAQMQELKKYPLNDFGDLFKRLHDELVFPGPRQESRLLPLLPQSTVLYAAFPNYGDTAQQALKIFHEELGAKPELRKWWQSGDMAKTGPQIEMAIGSFSLLSQYLGDEIAISGAMNGNKPPSILLLAEVRKPGLKQVLEFAVQKLAGSGTPHIRILDPGSLATVGQNNPREMLVLVRPDYVIASSDLETLRDFNHQLDSGSRAFATMPFGQRLQQSYNGGVVMLGGVDLQKLLHKAPIPAQQQSILRQTGFEDVKYAIWEHRGVPGHATSEAELSFSGPRQGIASWLASPRELGGLDFASPKAMLVASIVLKNPPDIFDDIQKLATSSNPKVFAQFDQMQQGMGFNLRNDLLSQLGGEITLELDDVKAGQPSWKAILQVNDSERLQQTLTKLLMMAPVSQQQSEEGGITYHSLVVPSPRRTLEIGYAFVDGYLVVGSGKESVQEAVGLHREGGSLGKSSKFLAALPPGHSTRLSGLLYEDPMKYLGTRMAMFSPEMARSFPIGAIKSTPVVVCAYGDESAIREASMSQGVDAGMIGILGAIAVPNLLRAKSAANESSAIANMRTIVTAQVTYSATYPARGYARDLARLGTDPFHPDAVSPQHAGLLDSSFAKPTCTVGVWCEKSGYKFTFAQVCPRLICQDFVAVATPASGSMVGKSFCATSDGVVRFKVGALLLNPISVRECRSWQPLQ